MKLLSFLLTLTISISCAAIANVDDDINYRLSTDDEISVTVFNEPDMSIEKIKVATNGTISIPLLGQVNVKGLTVVEVEQKLSTLLVNGYLKKPDVTISISEYRPFYINGEVKQPGSYPYRRDLTIEKAVALAGGFTARASKSSISLLSENDQRVLNKVLLNAAVKPGDVITVSESFF
jgi:protein involved in polysaccharide export with SLBB domain